MSKIPIQSMSAGEFLIMASEWAKCPLILTALYTYKGNLVKYKDKGQVVHYMVDV